MAGNAAAFDAALDDLAELLAQQCDAVREGQADALALLARSVNARLATLVESAGATGAPATRARLAHLCSRARANLEMLSRRQLDVQRSLDALGSADAILRDTQTHRVYAAAGLMSGPAWRSRAFAQA